MQERSFPRILSIGWMVAGATLAAALAAPALAQVEIQSFEQSYVVGDATRLKVDVAFGELTVTGTDGNEVEVEFQLECSRQDLDKCRRRAEKIRVVPRIKGSTFRVHLDHTPRGRIQGIKATMTLRVPRRLALVVNFQGGDVFIDGMGSDIEADGTAGNIDVVAPRDTAGRVTVSVAVGKAELWLGDGHIKGTGFPRRIDWQGSGASRLLLDVETGDVRVRLE